MEGDGDRWCNAHHRPLPHGRGSDRGHSGRSCSETAERCGVFGGWRVWYRALSRSVAMRLRTLRLSVLVFALGACEAAAPPPPPPLPTTPTPPPPAPTVTAAVEATAQPAKPTYPQPPPPEP